MYEGGGGGRQVWDKAGIILGGAGCLLVGGIVFGMVGLKDCNDRAGWIGLGLGGSSVGRCCNDDALIGGSGGGCNGGASLIDIDCK